LNGQWNDAIPEERLVLWLLNDYTKRSRGTLYGRTGFLWFSTYELSLWDRATVGGAYQIFWEMTVFLWPMSDLSKALTLISNF
jgi:hypothetical protein